MINCIDSVYQRAIFTFCYNTGDKTFLLDSKEISKINMAVYGLSEACNLQVSDFHNKTHAAWRFSDVRLVNNSVSK